MLSTTLIPVERVLLVAPLGIESIAPEDLTIAKVGHKAFGLACLPAPWTLPFLVAASDLFDQYREALDKSRTKVVRTWANAIAAAATSQLGLKPDESIVIRSSAVSESLEARGRYFSASGALNSLASVLTSCLRKFEQDAELRSSQIHLIVQREVRPISGKGHLSNERHCYEEARDWLGQFEDSNATENESFTINLRAWRTKESPSTEKGPLRCNLRAFVGKVLKAVAGWGYRQKSRLHFEWVWDGVQLYIVQVDEAHKAIGADPTIEHDFNQRVHAKYELKVLSRITAAHAKKYHKIANVYTYLKLQLPIADLYVLDDPKILESLLAGSPPQALLDDLGELARRSLVIRTDLTSSDKAERQLLPRTNEVRNPKDAVTFLQSTLRTIRKSNVNAQIAFIFHNFIPAVSSAFAYAAPNQRKVWIEALWGLPEGLYYNSHDKIEVDTLKPDASLIGEGDLKKFAVFKRPRFKRYFVSPDSKGQWVVKTVAEPWDWRISIQKEDWIRKIALNSRQIAAEDGRAVSIMWFANVPDWASESAVFPWYHEPFDLAQIGRAPANRRKTPFDKSHQIRTRRDVEVLQAEAVAPTTRIRQIRIQPSEEPLLRDRDLLRTVGDLARRIDAVILLEGSTLSHAYYQLLQTHAVVEVVHPFDAPDEKREFNKLVRDDIPARIAQGGETVRVSKLSGELLLRALRDKLVEEAFEALDATSLETIVDELADVDEVIGAVLKQLGVSRSTLARRRTTKRVKAGGFEKGYVLLDTNNPTLMSSAPSEGTLPLDLGYEGPTAQIAHGQLPASASILARWADKREHGSASENILKIVISLVRDKWSAESTEIPLGDRDERVVRARVQGKRSGASLNLEISIYVPPHQLQLLK
ncbi:MAG: nucleoside triphosphate pyrophosphohydrolase [Fimbriimonadaceae bacterium]